MTSLGDTLGAIELGVLFAAILYGVLLVQVYNYYQQHFNDGIWVKSLLYSVLSIETAHMAFIIVYIYIVTVKYYGLVFADGAFAWTAYVWPLAYSVTFANISAALVQGFFSYRMYMLSRRWYLPLFSWTFIIIRLGSAIAASVVATSTGDLLSFFQDHELLILLGQGSGLIVDIFNTVCLCILLWSHRRISHRNRGTIDKLILWTVETGLVTSICSIIMVILISGKLPNTIWTVFMLITARLYSNSLMATLNCRSSLLQSVKVITTKELTAAALQGNPSTGHAIEVHVDIHQDGSGRMVGPEQRSDIELGSLHRDGSDETK